MKTTRFWKECKFCYGTGEVSANSCYAAPVEGMPTGYDYPEIRGGHSGEIVADPDRSFCAVCQGTGMLVKKA